MRLLPIVTAVIVMGVLYLMIFERDRVMDFARTPPGAQEPVEIVDDAQSEAEVPQATGALDVEAVKVVAMRSQAQAIDSAVVLRGRTEAARQVDVRAETNGQVISEPLRKGTTVSEGDLLCRLDPGTRQSLLDEARARLVEAEARLPEAQARVPAARAALAEAEARRGEGRARVLEAQARQREAEINRSAADRLSEGGFASETRVASAEAADESARAGVTSARAALSGIESQISSAEAGIEGALAAVEGARAQIESARAGVASAERELERLEIRAPFGGLLESDTAELGSFLQPGGACATIIQLDPIKLVGFVPEVDVERIDTGATAGARLTSGREVVGEVTFVSRSADQTTRTFRLEVTVANADLSIRDGQTAEILVAADGRQAHLLPQSSLTLDDNGRLGVRTVGEDNIVSFMPVTLVRDTAEGVWVSGLPDEVAVITVGQEFVVDGVAVEPTFEEAEG